MFLESVLQATSTELLVGFGTLLLVYLFVKWSGSVFGNYPPGPMGVPIAGYLPFLTANAHLKLTELSKKYGEVFSLNLGSLPVVVLSGAESIKEAFSKSQLLGRPPHSALTLFEVDTPFFTGDMNVWQEHRRFVVQSMKDHGLGKSKTEEHIALEIKNVVDVVMKHNGQPFDPLPVLTSSMSNNISSLIFGKRYEYDDPERKFLDNCLEKASSAVGQTEFHIFFPWMKYIPFLLKLTNFEGSKESFKRMYQFFRKKIIARKSTLDSNNLDDFLDSYLVEMQSRKAKDPDTTLSETMMIGSMMNLFGAGSETVRSTLRWTLYIMAAYPDVQKRVQNEISEVLGTETGPEYNKHLKLMPYTHSVILEIMRWKTVVPLNLLRYTLGDIKIGGYDIPRGTTVLANFHAVHHDPMSFKEPQNFNPSRFLSPDQASVVKSGDFMPFSVGKRACPGETMAYMEIFLYFVTLLQKFDVAFPEGFTPTYDTELTITHRLKPYRIRLIPRH